MNNIQIFNNKNFGEIRVIEKDNKILFCGSDVAKILGYVIPTKAVNTHCKGVSKMEVPTNGGIQQMLFIPEGDVYRLIIRSNLPTAEQFEKWVFDEVLPSIRKHGGYINGQENMSKEEILARSLLLAQSIIDEKNKELEQKNLKIAEDKPFVDFAQRVTKSNDNMLVRDYAKLLCDEGFGIGEKRLYKYLRDNNYLSSDNIPYQRYVDQGYFFVKEETRVSPTGKVHLYKTTLVTPKGQLWIYSKIEKEPMFSK